MAAGSALGRAGLWRECVGLAAEPDSISTYGPVSVALHHLVMCTSRCLTAYQYCSNDSP